ncbi:hypothetical protein M9458_034558, partial [Cirrhinus mrigala]
MSSCSIHSSTKIIPAIARYFGTKGRYEEASTYLIDDILAVNNSLVTLPSSNCKEIHLTAIIRHGTRDDMDGRLVDKGRADHRHLAQRLIKWFPSLLTQDNVRRGRVKLITSSKHRCVNSTIAFREGLIKGLSME